MRTKITKRQVDALLPGCIIADEEVKGFVARRMPSGAVTYGFRYRDKKTASSAGLLSGCMGRSRQTRCGISPRSAPAR
jgi:hypothetical protein